MMMAGTKRRLTRSASRCAGPLCLLHPPHDVGENGLRSHRLSLYGEDSVAVDGPGHDGVARGLVGRYGFAVDHAFVDIRFPLDDTPVDRHLFTGTHEYAVAGFQRGDVYLAHSVGRNFHGGLRLQTHQAFQGCRGVVFGTLFHELAGEHEGDDHARGIVVDLGGDALAFPVLGKEGHGQAEQEGHAGAQGHERVHVCRALA